MGLTLCSPSLSLRKIANNSHLVVCAVHPLCTPSLIPAWPNDPAFSSHREFWLRLGVVATFLSACSVAPITHKTQMRLCFVGGILSQMESYLFSLRVIFFGRVLGQPHSHFMRDIHFTWIVDLCCKLLVRQYAFPFCFWHIDLRHKCVLLLTLKRGVRYIQRETQVRHRQGVFGLGRVIFLHNITSVFPDHVIITTGIELPIFFRLLHRLDV